LNLYKLFGDATSEKAMLSNIINPDIIINNGRIKIERVYVHKVERSTLKKKKELLVIFNIVEFEN
jgi:hypothetical protein